MFKQPNRERVSSVLRHLGFEGFGSCKPNFETEVVRKYYEDEQFQTAIHAVANGIDEILFPSQSKLV